MKFINKTTRIFGYIGIFLLVILVLGLASLTTVLSSQWGQQLMKDRLEKEFSAEVSWDRTELHFFGPQQVNGLKIQNLLTVDEMILDRPLYTLFFGFREVASLSVKNLNLQLNDPSIELQNVNGKIEIQRDAPFIAHFSGQTIFEGQRGEFFADLSLFIDEKWQIDPSRPHTINVEANHFPLSILVASFNLDQDLTNWIGRTVDINFQQHTSDQDEIACTLTASSQNLEAHAEFIIDSHSISLSNEGVINLTIHPQSIGDGTLLSQTQATLNLQSFSIPLLPEINWENASAVADLVIQPANLQFGETQLALKQTVGQFFLSSGQSVLELNGDASFQDGFSPWSLSADFDPLFQVNQIELKHEAQVSPLIGENLRLTLTSRAPDTFDLSLNSSNIQMDDAALSLRDQLLTSRHILIKSPEITLHSPQLQWDAEGGNLYIPSVTFEPGTPPLRDLRGNFSWDFENVSLENPHLTLFIKGSHTEARWQNLPIDILCSLLSLDEDACRKLLFSLGETTEGNVILTPQSEVVGNVRGQLGHCQLRGRIEHEHLTLIDPFVVETTATPQLGHYVLSDFLGLFKGLRSSSEPINLILSSQDFFAPIAPFTIENTQIGQGKIQLGKMLFNRTNELRGVLSLLTKDVPETFEIWMTPLYFSLIDGKLTIHRTDMLVMNRYPMAFWGTIDLKNNRVDMTLGISGAALESIVGVNLGGSNKMLTVPIRGTMDGASVSTTVAARKIATLIASSSTGPVGSVLGVALDLLGGVLGERPPPPPTTSPLPWASQMPQEEKKGNSTIKKIEGQVLPFLEKLLN